MPETDSVMAPAFLILHETLNFKTRPRTDRHPPAIWSISLSSLIVFQLSASASNAQSEHQSNALLMRGRTQMRQKVAENIPEKSQALGPLVWWTERIWHMLLGPLGASARVQLFASFHGERRERRARSLCQLGGDEAALPGIAVRQMWGTFVTEGERGACQQHPNRSGLTNLQLRCGGNEELTCFQLPTRDLCRSLYQVFRLKSFI